MTPEQKKYIQKNKPERFYRIQAEIPPAVVLDIGNIEVEVCHHGKYTGLVNADGSPNLDNTDIPLGTIINLGTLSEIGKKAINTEEFLAACQLVFNELNLQATGQIKQARLSDEKT